MSSAIRVLFAVIVCAACNNDPPSSPPSGPPPDAGVMKVPPPQACDTGDPPCPSGTTCTDFGVFGGPLCVGHCSANADCPASFVCVADSNNTGWCAPSEYGPPAGADPELICYDENTCQVGWGSNQSGCVSAMNACLDALTPTQLDQWEQYISSCVQNNSTCSGLFDCYAARPSC